MKYQRIPEIIEAEEYKVGMEDGFGYHCNYWETSTTADCHKNKHCGEQCDGEWRMKTAYINGIGGKNYVAPGWFIVTNEYGGKSVHTPEQFHSMFEEVKD